jgi:hypothetical protein
MGRIARMLLAGLTFGALAVGCYPAIEADYYRPGYTTPLAYDYPAGTYIQGGYYWVPYYWSGQRYYRRGPRFYGYRYGYRAPPHYNYYSRPAAPYRAAPYYGHRAAPRM